MYCRTALYRKKTNTFIAVHITKSQSLILLPCKSEMLVSTNAILFVYSDSASAHFGDNASEREGGRAKREGWHKRPQTPQIGFQSVLIYSSPWGLLSVVIRLSPWLTRSVSFMLQTPCPVPASRMAWGNENGERQSAVDPKESTLCCCAFPAFKSLRVFTALRKGECELSCRHDMVSSRACLMRESTRRKERKKHLEEPRLCRMKCLLPLTLSLSPFYSILLSASALIPPPSFFSDSLSHCFHCSSHFLSLSTVCRRQLYPFEAYIAA